ncbi:MAG TPA: DUF899 family protein [bacterium]|jgi:predicted dithiol-disulfide oxidoreductase (DUF899 family)
MTEKAGLETQRREMWDELQELRKRMVEISREIGAMDVEDYVLKDPDGSPVCLSELFEGRKDLILVHNMGVMCPDCTMWADGFNGLRHHLENRAALVVCTPDEPSIMKKFAESRGWKFRMVSGHGSTFIYDMGYERGKGGWFPGVSAFYKNKDGKITRVATEEFEEGDVYCATWQLFALLKDGWNGWQADFKYSSVIPGTG